VRKRALTRRAGCLDRRYFASAAGNPCGICKCGCVHPVPGGDTDSRTQRFGELDTNRYGFRNSFRDALAERDAKSESFGFAVVIGHAYTDAEREIAGQSRTGDQLQKD
jgi:hypothetical protein